MRRGLSDERGPLRRGQLETQSGSLLERIRRGRAAALPEFFLEPPHGGSKFLAGSLTTSGHRMEPGAAGAADDRGAASLSSSRLGGTGSARSAAVLGSLRLGR